MQCFDHVNKVGVNVGPDNLPLVIVPDTVEVLVLDMFLYLHVYIYIRVFHSSVVDW